MAKRVIEIDPITRLEGHGKISIFLDEAGDVDRAVLQIPELRAFAVDGDRLVVQGQPKKIVQKSLAVVLHDVPRSEGVRQAQTEHPKSVEPVVEEVVHLAGELVDPVDVGGVERV